MNEFSLLNEKSKLSKIWIGRATKTSNPSATPSSSTCGVAASLLSRRFSQNDSKANLKNRRKKRTEGERLKLSLRNRSKRQKELKEKLPNRLRGQL